MLFDTAPKTNKQDLYNRETELEKFKAAIEHSSLIVIQGLRRTGKTSFMNVALRETQQPYIILDIRGLPFNPSQADIVRRIETAFNTLNKKWFSQLQTALRPIKGVTILGNSISLDWSKEGIDFATFFDRVNTWAEEKDTKFLLAFDEIQLIRGNKNLIRLFAHIIDYNQNLCLIVTGSEIGLLFGFLGLDDPESPLYGRHYTEIAIRNFEESESKHFLITGFAQIETKIQEEVLGYAVEKLNGTVGWLTSFGARCRENQEATKAQVDMVASEGGKLARSEAEKIAQYSRRYSVVLNYLAAAKEASWSQIKSIMEAHENRSLTNSTVSDILNKLVKASLIEKNDEYSISDPLLKHGLLENPLPER
jgi:hypothetical protein